MKFTQISLKNLSENDFPFSSFNFINTVSKSDLSLLFSACKASSFLLVLITSSANLLTPFIDSFSSFSGPMLRALIIFHIPVGVRNRRTEASVALSNARAKGISGSPGLRHPGSTPKAIIQILSKVSLRSTSCKSIGMELLSASSRTGRSLLWTNSRDDSVVSWRNRAEWNSMLAVFLWRCHVSSSALKIPSPRRSRRVFLKYSPFGKFENLVFKRCSRFRGSAVTTHLRLLSAGPLKWNVPPWRQRISLSHSYMLLCLRPTIMEGNIPTNGHAGKP
uniref:Uncharacterized protein n=1 Tax=Opuntia streptacantha TaxID=393608 RepID=A0A7C9A8S5_OPUST